MHIKNLTNVYITGIGGVGISAIAQLLHANAVKVIGSDPNISHITKILEKQGIVINKEQIAKNITDATELHIYSPAVPEHNPERQYCLKNNIPSMSYPEFLGMLSKDYYTIAISGTNGKTTTTALIGHIFEEAGLDPTVIVGSIVPKWQSNIRVGKSHGKKQFLIVEACEHNAHMLNLDTNNIILTNIEEDHLDFYKDINHIIQTFQIFIDNNNYKGVIVLNNDDKYTAKLMHKDIETIFYGINDDTKVQAINLSVEGELQKFDILYNGQVYNDFTLKLPAQFNLYNTLSAISICLYHDIDIDVIKESIATFEGTWRRFERLPQYKGATIISDYAHHPTAVQETITAAKEFFPDKRIVVVFQPHQHSRTKNLFNEFTQSFKNTDLIIISEIFDVLGREEIDDQNISSADLVKYLQEKGHVAYFAKSLGNVKNLIDEYIQAGDIVLIMGAGDIYQVAEGLNRT